MYMRGVLINKFTDAYPSIPIRTIKDIEKFTMYKNNIKRTELHTVFTEEVEEHIKICIISMKKSGVPVKRGMLLTNGNRLYLEAFGMNTRSRQGLRHGWIHKFMEVYSLLTIRSSNIIKRVID